MRRAISGVIAHVRRPATRVNIKARWKIWQAPVGYERRRAIPHGMSMCAELPHGPAPTLALCPTFDPRCRWLTTVDACSDDGAGLAEGCAAHDGPCDGPLSVAAPLLRFSRRNLHQTL